MFAMRDELSADYREAFRQTLEVGGTDLDFRGTRHRAVRSVLDDGNIRYRFLHEFAVNQGERFTEIATETRYEVLDFQSVPIAGGFFAFEVTAFPVS